MTNVEVLKSLEEGRPEKGWQTNKRSPVDRATESNVYGIRYNTLNVGEFLFLVASTKQNTSGVSLEATFQPSLIINEEEYKSKLIKT